MQICFGSRLVLRRYLTPFYRIALGLVILVLLSGCDRQANNIQNTATITQEAISAQARTPTPDSTPPNIRSKPTHLPAIPPTPNIQTPSPLGVDAEALRGVQVNLWAPWSGLSGDALQAILEDYNRTNQWGITVQMSSYPDFGSLDEAVESAVSTKELPEVLIDYGYQAQHWDESGVVTDLTPYVNDPVWGMTNAEINDFYPAFWMEDLVKGDNLGQTRRLGAPFYRSAYVLFYNQSWAKELGFTTPPVNPGDFKLQACTAAVTSGMQGKQSIPGHGGWLVTAQPGELVGWIYAFGGDMTNPEGPGYTFNTRETQQAFEYIKGLQQSGCAWSDAGVDSLSEFANRQALFVVGSLYDIPKQELAFAKAGNNDTWVVIPFPSSNHPVVVTYGPSLLITANDPREKLAAWLVTKWLVYPPNLTDWVGEISAFPTRQSSLSYLDGAEGNNSQYTEALQLIADAHGEPSIASWKVMRWALSDVMSQLVNPKVTIDQIPALLESLDGIAAEIYNQVH